MPGMRLAAGNDRRIGTILAGGVLQGAGKGPMLKKESPDLRHTRGLALAAAAVASVASPPCGDAKITNAALSEQKKVAEPLYTIDERNRPRAVSPPTRINRAEAVLSEGMDSGPEDRHFAGVSPALTVSESQPNSVSAFLYRALKRSLDIFGSLLGLILLLPVYAMLAVLVRRDSPGPIFHRRRVLAHQQWDGESSLLTFDAFKFRTMRVDADDFLFSNPQMRSVFEQNHKLANDPRITPLGRTLRRLSLDELPQLLNVLRGQMSLVGPRMIAPMELERYGGDGAKLLSVKPGLTGLWQVSGRQSVSYAERVRLDMYYIDNRSTVLDLLILMKTIPCVLTGKGAV